MAYCTIEDIKTLLPEETLVQLTDDEGAGTMHPGRVQEAIAQADAEIDSYCNTKFTVPFADPAPIVKKLSVDIAIYNLYSRRGEKIPETRSERYKNAVRQLEGIAKGTIKLGKDPELAALTQGGPEATKSATDRTFTKTTLGGY
jgi:phage gp36-like protein